jgi:hypothetical protein
MVAQSMLNLLPKEDHRLESDDLDDLTVVLTKTTNKAHQAETEAIKEEERREIEDAKCVCGRVVSGVVVVAQVSSPARVALPC